MADPERRCAQRTRACPTMTKSNSSPFAARSTGRLLASACPLSRGRAALSAVAAAANVPTAGVPHRHKSIAIQSRPYKSIMLRDL